MNEQPTHQAPENEAPEVLEISRPRDRRAFISALSASVAAGTLAEGCDKGTAPSSVTTTIASTAPTTVATTTTTTIPPPPPTTVGPTFTLTVIVTNAANGRGLLGARVSATSGPQAGRSQLTDANGRCELNGMSASTFSVRIELAGYNTQNETVSLSTSRSLEVRLGAIGSTTTQGQSTSSQGAPNPGCSPQTPPPAPCESPTHYWYPN